MTTASLRLVVLAAAPDDGGALRRCTSELGWRLLQAPDGARAADIIRHGGIDLVLLDTALQRPDALSAARAMRALAPSWPGPPIVALLPDIDPAAIARVGEAGMDGFLVKPVEKARLAALARLLLRSVDAAGVDDVQEEEGRQEGADENESHGIDTAGTLKAGL